MQDMKAVVAMVALALGACTEELDQRLCNQSAFALVDVHAAEFVGVNLAAGECTDYRRATGRSYRYECVFAALGTENLQWCPLDQHGESPLPGGRWTYEITIMESFGQHDIRLAAVEDEH